MNYNIVSLLDLTSLNDSDTEEQIVELCEKAVSYQTAAICVYPQFIKLACQLIKGQVKAATVANFPHGNNGIHQVLASIRDAVADGAQEIDVVFPYQDFLAGNYEEAAGFVSACKKACGNSILLKVILETGALKESAQIAMASKIAIDAGADFLKTSTGKITMGASLDAAEIMLLTIKDSKKKVGFKASGGIRSLEQAEKYVGLADQIMGAAWVRPETFRIGSSRLLS